MKLAILSDTHGSIAAVEQVFAAASDAEMFLHAGDVTPDAKYLATLTEAPVYFVAGNCDWPEARVPLTRVIEAAGHRIFLAHGDSFGVRYTTEMLARAAAEQGCDLAVYGHTHVAEVSIGTPVTVLNPGSAARPRDGARGSFLTLDLRPDELPVARLHRLS